MAMTKKEKAEFDSAIQRANTLAALRWTEPVKKDLPAPQGFRESTCGWDYNTYSCSIRQMWSECTAHGEGLARSSSASQNGRSLFSTKLLALRALRHAIECESAEKLRRIDEQISLERANTEPTVEHSA